MSTKLYIAQLFNSVCSVAVAQEAASTEMLEIEHLFYGKIADFEDLKKADYWEDQEQWTIIPKETNNGNIRVRKTVTGERTAYELTCKVKKDEGKLETEIEVDSHIFESFKTISPSGMLKRRFVFKIECGVGKCLKWELDVFIKPNGEYHEWCKIDLEVPDSQTQIPEFPIPFTHVIRDDRNIPMTLEDRQIVDHLYENVFKTLNPIIGA
jgi:hypothetical protein